MFHFLLTNFLARTTLEGRLDNGRSLASGYFVARAAVHMVHLNSKKQKTESKNYPQDIPSSLRSNLLSSTFLSSPEKGLTLVELLVAITILATLIGGLLLTLNPFRQIEKAQDSSRQSDLQQVKNAVESYYQDTNCYPTSIPFGEEWSEDGVVYMKDVPQDPTCDVAGGTCYQYVTDEEAPNNCPQWNIVFAKLSEAQEGANVCPLSTLSDACTPEGYDESWACVMSGAVNCSLVALGGLGYDSGNGPVVSITPTASPVPTGSAQPFPSIPPYPESVTITGLGSFQRNPYVTTLHFIPQWPEPDAAQTFYVAAQDSAADITSIQMHLFSDSGEQVLTLNFAGGTVRNGMWGGTIEADTYNNQYGIAIVAQNALGQRTCQPLTMQDRFTPGPDAVCDAIQ